MDPVTMILAFAMKNPQITSSTIDNYRTPGQVEVVKLNESLADFAIQTLNCYHKSARYRDVQILATRWRDHYKFGAEQSIVMKVHFQGMSGIPYQMIVAAMAQGNRYRTFVLDENTLVPYNRHCTLESWTATDRREDQTVSAEE